MTKTQKIITSAVAVLVLFGGYVLFTRNTTDDKNTGTQVATTTSTQGNSSVSGVISGNGYTIEQVPVAQTKPSMAVPSLDRPLTPYAGYPVAPEAKAFAESKVKSIQAELKKDTKNWSKWIDLGISQKAGGDFLGAVLSWKYASYIAPKDQVSLANLGNLYAYFLKDNAQAEIYYKQAIKVAPAQTYLYAQLSDVYKDVFQDKEKALAIVEEGLKQIPNDSLLLQMKENLNK